MSATGKNQVSTGQLRSILDGLLWPALLTVCLLLTWLAFASAYPLLGFNLIYLGLATCLLLLERWRPHRRDWQNADGQNFPNIAHTLLNKGLVQFIVIFAAFNGLDQLAPSIADAVNQRGLWPHAWPMFWQLLLALVIAEFGLYWVHRLAHEWPLLWRFHAVHHSVERLWWLNTGRFHFVDSLLSVIVGMSLLIILGAPLEILLWLSAITAYIGILTHCNVRMHNRWLSRLFNTPDLHRWHHSRIRAEGDRNFGENLMLWDRIFASFYLPRRSPPENIGINESMPDAFTGQLLHPFRRR